MRPVPGAQKQSVEARKPRDLHQLVLAQLEHEGDDRHRQQFCGDEDENAEKHLPVRQQIEAGELDRLDQQHRQPEHHQHRIGRQDGNESRHPALERGHRQQAHQPVAKLHRLAPQPRFHQHDDGEEEPEGIEELAHGMGLESTIFSTSKTKCLMEQGSQRRYFHRKRARSTSWQHTFLR